MKAIYARLLTAIDKCNTYILEYLNRIIKNLIEVISEIINNFTLFINISTRSILSFLKELK